MSLKFPFDEVLELAEFNLANSQSPNYIQFDLNQEELNSKRALHLVGDQGVYLMTGTVERKPLPEGGKYRPSKGDVMHVLYAEGCHPSHDEDFYERKVSEFGGDDGVEDLPLSVVFEIQKQLESIGVELCQAKLVVQITESTISFSYEIPKGAE